MADLAGYIADGNVIRKLAKVAIECFLVRTARFKHRFGSLAAFVTWSRPGAPRAISGNDNIPPLARRDFARICIFAPLCEVAR